MSPSLYEQIGPKLLSEIITEFYKQAFVDGIIGHFFFGKDRAHITALQIDFASGALGGPRTYRGRSLVEAHKDLSIRRPHFARRQILMAEVMDTLGLEENLKIQWLAVEEQLRPLIMGRRGS